MSLCMFIHGETWGWSLWGSCVLGHRESEQNAPSPFYVVFRHVCMYNVYEPQYHHSFVKHLLVMLLCYNFRLSQFALFMHMSLYDPRQGGGDMELIMWWNWVGKHF